MYFLAIVLPPVAVLFCGKPFQALLNLFLTLCFWFPGAIHALFVVKDKKDEKRMRRQSDLLVKSQKQNGENDEEHP